jgi:hypothetical protein
LKIFVMPGGGGGRPMKPSPGAASVAAGAASAGVESASSGAAAASPGEPPAPGAPPSLLAPPLPSGAPPDLTLADAVGLHLMKAQSLRSCWSTDFHLGLTGVPLVIDMA